MAEMGVKGSCCPEEEEELKKNWCHKYKYYTNIQYSMLVMPDYEAGGCINENRR